MQRAQGDLAFWHTPRRAAVERCPCPPHEAARRLRCSSLPGVPCAWPAAAVTEVPPAVEKRSSRALPGPLDAALSGFVLAPARARSRRSCSRSGGFLKRPFAQLCRTRTHRTLQEFSARLRSRAARATVHASSSMSTRTLQSGQTPLKGSGRVQTWPQRPHLLCLCPSLLSPCFCAGAASTARLFWTTPTASSTSSGGSACCTQLCTGGRHVGGICGGVSVETW
mmetsp:Transcript_115341/g.337202  ORF Transcript_115341/g.337202 Transcript_115341/m.337202 type:complete len:224 (-) Transcript_115341:1022-1693(-)